MYYVTALSRSKAPDGRRHKLVAECKNYIHAAELHALWSTLDDRSYVNIRTTYPYSNKYHVTLYNVQLTDIMTSVQDTAN